MMPPLLLTSTGFIVIGVIITSVYFSYRISKRLKDSGCLSIGFTFTLFISVLSIFFSALFITANSSFIYFTGDNYSAKIVGYESYRDRYTDSDNRTRYTTMYIPVLEFKDKNGSIKRVNSSTHTGEVPEVGSTIKITYSANNNDLVENNITTLMLVIAGLLFSIVFGFLSVALIAYAFGKPMSGFKELFAKSLLSSLPVCLGLFFILLAYSIYQHFSGGANMPLWALVIVIAGMVGILLALYSLYFKKSPA